MSLVSDISLVSPLAPRAAPVKASRAPE